MALEDSCSNLMRKPHPFRNSQSYVNVHLDTRILTLHMALAHTCNMKAAFTCTCRIYHIKPG